MSSPVADQILSAIGEVERVWPHNAHLVEDAVIGELVEDAVRGASAPDAVGVVDARVRWVPARAHLVENPETYEARTFGPHSSELRWECRIECVRCWDPLSEQWRFPETSGRILWVPAGSVIVTMLLCPKCTTELTRDYQPVWR